MKRWCGVVWLVSFLLALPLAAHFQILLPSNDVIENRGAALKVSLAFGHPFDQKYLPMQKPNEFGYYLDGKPYSLLFNLTPVKVGGVETYLLEFQPKKMGTYRFFVETTPYFEPSEKLFIKQIAQTIVDVYGADSGWDEPLGLKAEIVPLTRPYSLYAGNLFQGRVLFRGKPVAESEVEIELFNSQKYKAPTPAHLTQVVKTDRNGIFSYVVPKAGWWGFSAIMLDDEQRTHEADGKRYPVEIGAVMWVKAYDLLKE